jgi:hypothetical protein
VDERNEELHAEDEKRDEQPERPPLTQRELVRASLLRCPPAQAGDPPRH